MTPRERVWKQMVQMFGPQWIDKWGPTNEVWDDALKPLTYSQVTAGLKAVMHGKLKYYELDLPNFLALCRPVVPIESRQVLLPGRPDWQNGMVQQEIDMHRFAAIKWLKWMVKKPDLLSDQQVNAMRLSTRRITHDFYEMRRELGEEKVPDADLVKALERQWERDLALGVSA